MQEFSDKIYKLKALERWENEGGLVLDQAELRRSSMEALTKKEGRDRAIEEASFLNDANKRRPQIKH